IEYYMEEELAAVWKSKALLKLTPGKNFVTRKNVSKNKRTWFLQLLKPDYPVLGIAAFLGIVISVLGLATAIFSQKLIDHILPEKNTRTLVLGLIIFAVILFARAVVMYIRTIFLVRQSREMNVRLISHFFGKLLFLPKPFFDSTSTGDMVARMNDAGRIQKTVVFLSSQVVIDLLVVLVSAGYIFVYSVSTGLFSLLSIPVFSLLAWQYNKKVIVAQREVMQSYAATESKYIDTINGIKTIKTFNRENLFAKVVNVVYGFFMQKVFDLGLLGAKMNFWINTGSALLLAGVISWTAWLVLQEQLLLGQMMAIVALVGSLGASLVNIVMANIQFQEARVAFDRMYEFASAEPEYNPEDATKEDENNDFQIEKLEIKNLNFRFPGKSLLLKDISFEVNRGEIITFFGEIGCGKSTLLSILQRFHNIESGTILVNDKNWNSFSTKAWRNHVAVVEQHVQLFYGTVLENISLQEKPDIEQVVTFCQKYGFHDYIMEFQQGYATIIHENSTNLSGGQRQLIALARAVYSQPQLLLLDEATAAMGRRTEKFVIELLHNLKKEIPVVFVTHRPQLTYYTDRIYVIENKTVSAFGIHTDLIKSNFFYRAAFEELVLC
ncbi:MAG: peptidase domain-containing ABC transporter, partial [Mariniphaga sp.]